MSDPIPPSSSAPETSGSTPEESAARLIGRLRLSARELADEPASIRRSQLRDDTLAALRDLPDPRSAVEAALAQLPEASALDPADDGRISGEALRPLVSALLATWPRLCDSALPIPSDVQETIRGSGRIDERSAEHIVRLAVAMLTSLSQVGRIARESSSDLDPAGVSDGRSGEDAWRAYQAAWSERDAGVIEREALDEIAEYVRSLVGVTR